MKRRYWTRTMMAIIITALLASSGMFAVRGAEAGIPVIRSFDGWKESLILSATTEIQNYIKDVLTNLDGIKSIMELADITKNFEDITKAFDLSGFDLEGMFKGMLGDFGGTMKTKNVGDALRTGKFEGTKISNTENDVIDVLQSGSVSTAAAITAERTKGVIEKALDLPATSGPDKGKETIKGEGKEEGKQADRSHLIHFTASSRPSKDS